ncbi:MAG: phytase, partial [Chloroflexi bacterium]|nr:phytase [Chloroflexota bacterium]
AHAQSVAATAAARVETQPVPHSGDAADDPAIWLHPSDPQQSTILGTDKQGGLGVYGLDGKQIQYLADGKLNNVDLRYNFQLSGQPTTIVTASNRTNGTIAIYRVNATTRKLENIAARRIYPSIGVYGACMYRSPSSGAYYVFVTSASGGVEQWELFGTSTGKVDARRVRSFSVGTRAEGCVADDVLGRFYVGSETVGIWRYAAEPSGGNERSLIDLVGAGGHLVGEVEGLTIYYTSGGNGYLLASSQGNSSFVVYERTGSNAYLKTFTIGAGNGVDAVSGTDGIDVTNVNLGPTFPQGLFVAQDTANDGGNQNFKLVPWQAIAQAGSPALTIDPSWDPRRVGSGGATPTPTATPAPTSTPTATPSPGATLTFRPIADARVEEANPGSNYGTSSTLRVDGGSDPDIESYLRFTVTGATTAVQSVKLRVYSTSSSANGPAVYATGGGWTESGITWSTRPSRTSGALDDRGSVAANTWLEYDLTSLITGDGTYNLLLALDNPDGINLSAREGSAVPQLVLTLGGSATPTPTAAPGTIALPGRVEVEDYAGFWDSSAGNSGGVYRSDDVDIQTTSDSSGAYNIAWVTAGEWLAYDVNIATAGSYTFAIRAATPHSDRRLHLELDGTNVSGPIALPTTGGWQTWTTVTTPPIALPSGRHTLRLVVDTDSLNLNYITVSAN